MVDIIRIEFQFFSTVIADILRALDGKSYGGAFTLSLCCIDYMGVAMSTEKDKNTKQGFKKYLNTYLSKLNSYYAIHADYLYAIRCSLVHTYGHSEATKKLNFSPNIIFNDPQGDFHFHHEKDSKKLFLSVHCFIADLIASIYDFFRVNNNNQMELNNWFTSLYYHYYEGIAKETKETVERGYIIYGKIHTKLAIIDSVKDPLEISNQIRLELDK